MNKQECIEQLQNLKAHCSDWGDEEPWIKDVKALEMAIKELNKTTHGVEVQEQLNVTFEYLIDKPSKIFLTNDKSLYKKLIQNNQAIYMFGPEISKSSNKDDVLKINIKDCYLVQILLDK